MISIEDVRKIASKFRIAQKQLLTEIYNLQKNGEDIILQSNRVDLLVLEKFIYDLVFFESEGSTHKTCVIEAFMEKEGLLYIYPNNKFISLYGVVIDEEIERKRKLEEIEAEEIELQAQSLQVFHVK